MFSLLYFWDKDGSIQKLVNWLSELMEGPDELGGCFNKIEPILTSYLFSDWPRHAIGL
jgi:hypothetical protein